MIIFATKEDTAHEERAEGIMITECVENKSERGGNNGLGGWRGTACTGAPASSLGGILKENMSTGQTVGRGPIRSWMMKSLPLGEGRSLGDQIMSYLSE